MLHEHIPNMVNFSKTIPKPVNYLEKTSEAKCTLWIYRITNVKILT